jgi:hypothetical protein
MRADRLVALCLGVIAALGLVSSSRADPISIVLDTKNLAMLTPPLTALTLYFQFNGVDGESVAITNFATDGTIDGTSIVTTGSVDGSLASKLTLNGSAAVLPSAEYFEPILLGDFIAFTFDVTSTNTSVGPLFAMSLVITDSFPPLPPLDDSGQAIIGNPFSGVLVQYDASGEPMLSLFSNDVVGVREGTVSNLVPEPGALALLSIALVALGMTRSRSRMLRLRG